MVVSTIASLSPISVQSDMSNNSKQLFTGKHHSSLSSLTAQWNDTGHDAIGWMLIHTYVSSYAGISQFLVHGVPRTTLPVGRSLGRN